MTAPTQITLDLNFDEYLGRYVQTGPDDYGTEPITLEQIVIDRAVDRIVELTVKGDSTYFRDIRERVAGITDEVIREHIAPLVETTIDKALQPTDGYGKPVGDPVNLRDVIVDQGVKLLTGQTRDRYGSKSENKVDKLIRDAVNSALTRELKNALDEAKAKVIEAVQAKGAEVLAKTIADLAKGK